MKFFRILLIISYILSLSLLPTACIDEEKLPNTPMGNFEELWRIIDERYCFLEYKEIDWNGIYAQYKQQITADMSDDRLFTVLGQMLEELKDGHVNLYDGNERVSYYWKWYEDFPRNFNEDFLRKYLEYGSQSDGDILYNIFNDNIGYIYCRSFSEPMDNGEFNSILSRMADCRGIIVDIRDNGGGSISNSVRLASRFTNEKVLTGYLKHKTGKGWNDFSSPKAIYLEPSNNLRWNKKVALLTNRHAYSAANDFVNAMSCLPNVTIVGDFTGGGSGLPFTSELPNGWAVRFSASPHFDADMNHIEFGIAPDVKVDITSEDEHKGIDTIIETARKLLR